MKNSLIKTIYSIELLHLLFYTFGIAIPLIYFFSKTDLSLLTDLLKPSAIKALKNTLVFSIATSILSTLIAFLFSWVFWRYRWNVGLKRKILLALKIPYLTPPFFFAMGWVIIATGFHSTVYGFWRAVVIFTLWSTAFAMIQLQSFFEQFPGALEDAAVLSGLSPFRSFLKITSRLAKPHLLSCFLLLFVNSSAAFGVPAMIALPDREHMITTLIYQSMKSSSDFSFVVSLSMILILVTLLALALQRFILKQRSFVLIAGKSSKPSALKPDIAGRIIYALACFFVLFSTILPLSAIVHQSLLRDRAHWDSFTFDKYLYVFNQIPEGKSALLNSLFCASLAALLITAISVFGCYGSIRLRLKSSRIFLNLWSFAQGLPGTVIALSLIVLFSGTLTDTLWILILAYLVKYTAFSLRTLGPSIASLSKELEEAAWMSGATPLRTFFSIVLRLLAPAISASVLLVFIPVLSELTMSILLVGSGTETLGALIYRLQEYADPGSASVFAVCVVAATLFFNFLVRKASKNRYGI